MTLEFRQAVRKAVPMLIGLAGPSGSGKTYSSLLLAAGIAGPEGRVGMLDTENGRGEMYADSPAIMKALSSGYEYTRLDPPFTPAAYVAGIEAAEKAGLQVLVVDSLSHEWEGTGGCEEIAEEYAIKGQPNWKMAKIAHKRFANHCLSASMYIIFCMRAREKVKFVKVGNKTEVVPIGIQPICEKNWMFEMLVSMRIEEETHHAIPVKVPEPLIHLFPKEVLITEGLGQRIREWNETGTALPVGEQLGKRARAAAEQGYKCYREFYDGLAKAQKKELRDADHEQLKRIAQEFDINQAAKEEQEQS